MFDRKMCEEHGIALNALIKSVEQKLSKTIRKFEDEYWNNRCLEIGYARRIDEHKIPD
jgi:hypothetical protein